LDVGQLPVLDYMMLDSHQEHLLCVTMHQGELLPLELIMRLLTPRE